MSVGFRDLRKLPSNADEVCRLADELLQDWLPALGSVPGAREDALPPSPCLLPVALDWAYRAFGHSGQLLFHQDPLVHLGDLGVDPHGVVTFRIEQQACAFWGFEANHAGGDPPVLIRYADGDDWYVFQDRVSTHVFEAVLGEAIFSEASISAGLEATPQALIALATLDQIGIPSHRMWTSPDSGPVRWFGLPDAVVRNDSDTWLWALGRTSTDLDRITSVIPGAWDRLSG